MYYGGFSYYETYNMPVSYKRWFIERIARELKSSNDKGNGSSRAAHHNSPEIRAVQERARQQVPAKLRRFT
jgi:predicted acetyltransferase